MATCRDLPTELAHELVVLTTRDRVFRADSPKVGTAQNVMIFLCVTFLSPAWIAEFSVLEMLYGGFEV